MKKLLLMLVVVGMLVGAGCDKLHGRFEGRTYSLDYKVQDIPTEIEPPIKSDYENTPGYTDEQWRMRQEQDVRVKGYQKELERYIPKPVQELDATRLAFIAACKRAAEYQIVWEDYRSREDLQNYLKWKREARRLAILLGY